jgi:hypothetical protein
MPSSRDRYVTRENAVDILERLLGRDSSPIVALMLWTDVGFYFIGSATEVLTYHTTGVETEGVHRWTDIKLTRHTSPLP